MKYMKYLKISVIILITIVMNLTINNVYAHPGRTDSNGCHYCRTNCAKWGLSQGQYHCHNGGSSSSSRTKSTKSSSSAKPNQSANLTKETTKPVVKIKKSNNAKLKKLLISNKEISVNKNMYYETDNDMETIEAIPESSKAKVEIDKPRFLEHGNNKIKITVTAEDQTKQVYNLNIVLKSSDVNIRKLTINNENVDIDKSKNKIKYSTTESIVSIEAIPSCENAQIFYQKELNLKDGNNETTIKVVAENGKEKEYTLEITKLKETSTIEGLIYILIIGGIIYLIYKKSSKKRKPKVNSKNNYCIKCGKPVTKSDIFCNYCGYNQKNK